MHLKRILSHSEFQFGSSYTYSNDFFLSRFFFLTPFLGIAFSIWVSLNKSEGKIGPDHCEQLDEFSWSTEMTPASLLGISSPTSLRVGACLMSKFLCYHQTLPQKLLLYALMVLDMPWTWSLISNTLDIGSQEPCSLKA